MNSNSRKLMEKLYGKQCQVDSAEIAPLLHQFAEPLPDLNSPAFAALFDRYADARVVMLGEASHGTSEFYRARAAITRRLIEQHGFNIVAVEADWPDAGHVDQYVRGLAHSAWKRHIFSRFPTWMWRNSEVKAFSHWLHGHNRLLAVERRVEFRGLDVYSLRNSIHEVLAFLDRADPHLAREARRRYGCLTPWQDDPALYGHFVERGGVMPCEQPVVEQLNVMLAEQLSGLIRNDEAFFNATQNARVIIAAEQYYRAIYRGSTASWNLRDRHMFDTLRALLEHRGPHAKAVVWAHNSHIGNADATEMGWKGQFNIGQLCRNAFGREAVLIGMATDRGQVAAASDWDGDMLIKDIRPSRSDSWEHQFRLAGVPASLTDWRDPQRKELRRILSMPLLERAIGVIYRPESERLSHYFEAVLAEQFDAMLWIEQTQPVNALPLPKQQHLEPEDETYPFGV
ncbi:erythromycin esterase family protein [Pseudomonas sp. 5FOS]|jgi:erythromycin esterase-like protein|uniref:erythromycin esterase family protein n=1 Tax=unclassified Pseudomonas TaxID=196821 RepID=UPI001A9E1DE3|nr:MULTISPECIES: erythromycin esterase family protein [unclassified Pseudomonas]MCE5987482.1 erythromycin esterase family protein [Pseudomonas sp. LM20]MCE5992971.1 erythromycin esterase family protein [Pseudomonas sp. KCA11]